MRHQGFARAAVERRDHGVCALCGIRPADLHGPLTRADERKTWRGFSPTSRAVDLGAALFRRWEADHIVPIVEGGGYGLDNLRTLCRVCHVLETRKLRARMSAHRGQP